jgi:hypothetical protein
MKQAGTKGMKRALGFAAVGIAAALFAGCSPAVPASPTFTADVGPIFMSHCVRCHGAGGTLQGDPIPGMGDPLDGGLQTLPTGGYLDQYDDPAACPDGSTTPCKHGAYYYATNPLGKVLMTSYLHPQAGTTAMPLPPAPRLSSWELEVVDRWLANPAR